MPPFAKEVLSDAQIDAIGDYLATLNEPGQRGPVIKLAGARRPRAPYDPIADGLQWLVDDEVRLQRGPLPGTSGPRHPRRQSERRELQLRSAPAGDREDLAGRLSRHVGRVHQSRRQGPRARLRKPRDRLRRSRVPARAAQCRGQDRSTSRSRKAKFGDLATMQGLAVQQGRPARAHRRGRCAVPGLLARLEQTSSPRPVFKYRVGKNIVEVGTSISEHGAVSIDGQRRARRGAGVRA